MLQLKEENVKVAILNEIQGGIFLIHKNFTSHFCSTKDLGSNNSHSYSKKKRWANENQQFLLDPSGNWGHRANHCPPNYRNRQEDTENPTHRNRSPETENSKASTSINDCWRLSVDSMRVKNSREVPSWGSFTVLRILPPGTLPSSHNEYQGKISSGFQAGGGRKLPLFNMPRTFLLNKTCTQETLTNLNLPDPNQPWESKILKLAQNNQIPCWL